MSLRDLAEVSELIGQAGGWPIAIFFALLLFGGMLTGRLVPASQARDIRVDRAARLAALEERVTDAEDAAAMWRTAHDESEAARRELTVLLRDVLAGVEGHPARRDGRGRHAGSP